MEANHTKVYVSMNVQISMCMFVWESKFLCHFLPSFMPLPLSPNPFPLNFSFFFTVNWLSLAQKHVSYHFICFGSSSFSVSLMVKKAIELFWPGASHQIPVLLPMLCRICRNPDHQGGLGLRSTRNLNPRLI